MRFNAAETFEITKNIQGWMRKEELQWLHKLATRQGPLTEWVEIGSWKGRSLVATAMGLPSGSKLTSVESFSGSEDSPGTHAEVNFPIPWVKRHLGLAADLIKGYRCMDLDLMMITGRSVETSKTFINGKLDVVFIDGAHNEKAVTEDIIAWKPKVKKGGILCGHDRGNAGVPKALKKTLGKWNEGAGSIWWVKT